MYSESDYFDEEEAQRDPDSECAPLIDPWYDIHPHFPKIPGDYAPSRPCAARSLPVKYGHFLGPIGLLDP